MHPIPAALLASFAATSAATSATAQDTPYRVGQPLPDLRLPTIDGERTVDLAHLRGRRVLLIEFAAW